MSPNTSPQPYGAVSMALHWSVAVLIVAQLGLGWYMNARLPDDSAIQERVEGVHISLGITTLILIVARIVWRFRVPPPLLPDEIPRWERALASATHLALYALMLALPLSGWIFMTIREADLHLWGMKWPGFPGLGSVLGDRAISRPISRWHQGPLPLLLLGVIGLHVLGAIKHQFDGRPVLWRMLPFLRRKPTP